MRVSHKPQHFGGNSEMREADSVVRQNTVSKEWENIDAGGYVQNCRERKNQILKSCVE